MRITRRTPLKRSAPPKRTKLKRSAPVKQPQWVLDFWDWVRGRPCLICHETVKQYNAAFIAGTPPCRSSAISTISHRSSARRRFAACVRGAIRVK